jgi:hypothetical protein
MGGIKHTFHEDCLKELYSPVTSFSGSINGSKSYSEKQNTAYTTSKEIKYCGINFVLDMGIMLNALITSVSFKKITQQTNDTTRSSLFHLLEIPQVPIYDT